VAGNEADDRRGEVNVEAERCELEFEADVEADIDGPPPSTSKSDNGGAFAVARSLAS
jgi:hypothetical protein